MTLNPDNLVSYWLKRSLVPNKIKILKIRSPIQIIYLGFFHLLKQHQQCVSGDDDVSHFTLPHDNLAETFKEHFSFYEETSQHTRKYQIKKNIYN